MVFQGKINVSPGVQFRVTVTRTRIVKKLMAYRNTLAAIIDAYIIGTRGLKIKAAMLEKNGKRG